jgi:hypothetical protein
MVKSANHYGESDPKGGGSPSLKGGNCCTDYSMSTKVVRHTIEKFIDNGGKEVVGLGSLNTNGQFTKNALAIITSKGPNCYMTVKEDADINFIKKRDNRALTEREFILKQEKACQERGSGFVYLNMSLQKYSEFNND